MPGSHRLSLIGVFCSGMNQRALRSSIVVLIALCTVGCDMRGDTNLNDPNHQTGSGNPAQDAVEFACETRATCFSGTQYCLKIYNGYGVAIEAGCVSYPNGGCRTRDCLLSDAKTQEQVKCHGWQEFHQDDSKITVICRTKQ